MCFKSKKKNLEPFASEPFTAQNLEPFKSKNPPYTSQATNSYEPQSTGYNPNLNYEFTLTEFGGKIEDGYREKDNPTEADLQAAVDNLALYDGDFFTLVGNESINGYRMIGGMTVYGEKLLTASVHVETGIKHGKHIGKAYDRQVTPEELLKLIKDFLNCRTPNVKDGTWVFDKDLEYPD